MNGETPALHRVAVIVLSDRAHSGERPDACIPAVKEALTGGRFDVDDERILPDDAAALQAALIELCDGPTRLPGSPKAVRETLDAIAAALPHALDQLAGVATDAHPPGYHPA